MTDICALHPKTGIYLLSVKLFGEFAKENAV